jgi:hypothetical protein
VLIRTTGVPKYKIEGSTLMCMEVGWTCSIPTTLRFLLSNCFFGGYFNLPLQLSGHSAV